jgi:hypothetical protein
MKKTITWVFIVACLTAAAIITAIQLPPSLAQRRSVAAAFAHGNILSDQIRQDARFTNVTIGGQSSDPKGLILAHGTVQSEADAIALHDLVASSHPPVAVLADIHIGNDPTIRTWPEIEWKIDPDDEYPWITTRIKESPNTAPGTYFRKSNTTP